MDHGYKNFNQGTSRGLKGGRSEPFAADLQTGGCVPGHSSGKVDAGREGGLRQGGGVPDRPSDRGPDRAGVCDGGGVGAAARPVAEQMTPCLETGKATQSNGYAKAWVPSEKRTKLLHRLAWEEKRGAIPPGMMVCHRCDNRRCINVDHLFLGTAADNTHDAMAKGRLASKANGNWDGRARKLSEQTHCLRGHPLSGKNIRPNERDGRRRCRACEVIRRSNRVEYLRKAMQL